MIKGIGIVNLSTVVNSSNITKMVSAISTQVSRDVCPNWGKTVVPIASYSAANQVPVGYAIMYIFDNTDQAGALGYHDETMQGQVYGKIFAHTIMGYGCPILYSATQSHNITVSSVLSHEVIELLMDPYVDLWANGPSISQGYLYAYELCDAVESNIYTINSTSASTVPGNFGFPKAISIITGTVSVSNFIYPTYFDTATPAHTKLDQMGVLTSPFSLASGGYMIVMDASGNVNEIFGETYPEFMKSVGCPGGVRNLARKA